MSNSETSNYDSFDSSITDTLLTSLRPLESKDSLDSIK